MKIIIKKNKKILKDLDVKWSRDKNWARGLKKNEGLDKIGCSQDWDKISYKSFLT